MENLTIPKVLHHIWVGSRPAPLEWMKTWQEKHPDWRYILWDNDAVFKKGRWMNQKHIDYMVEHELWAGVADIVRYEILHMYGGFVAPADSICLHAIDELFLDPAYDAYSVYENEKVRAGLVSPLLASTKGNALADKLVKLLMLKEQVGEPWKTTGNVFMQHALGALEYPRIKLWPSFFFIPQHYSGERYEGGGKVYATHEWGSHGAYDKPTTT